MSYTDMGKDFLTNQILGDGTFDRAVTHDFTEIERIVRARLRIGFCHAYRHDRCA
jgi:hypothetical protein